MTSAKSRSRSGVAKGYLHGFTHEEQDRLYRQARFLEASVFDRVDFSKRKKLIEVGCGVGAQTEILLERFPKLTIQGVDAAPVQIERAKKHLSAAVRAGRVKLDVADALNLPYSKGSFDSAFVCWFLEHVRKPIEILTEIRRVLEPGGMIHCTEVLNSSLYVHPYSPAMIQYWFAYNDHQWNLGGDPFVGAKLGNYLLAAGFQDIETFASVHHCDNRSPKRRAQFIEYWTPLLLSGAPGLIQAGKTTKKIVDQMKRELNRLKDDPDAVFFYTAIQARAQAS